MGRLKTLEQQVRAILATNMRARDDDRELAFEVWTKIYGVNPWSPLVEVMRNQSLPSQESIGRCRRKIQEKDVSLRGSKHKEAIRMAEQQTFIEYALSDR